MAYLRDTFFHQKEGIKNVVLKMGYGDCFLKRIFPEKSHNYNLSQPHDHQLNTAIDSMAHTAKIILS
jgi:hypothetical protein